MMAPSHAATSVTTPGFYSAPVYLEPQSITPLQQPLPRLSRPSRIVGLTRAMGPQQPTARGIRIRNTHDAHLLFYAVVRTLFSLLAIPNSSPFLFEQVSERRHCPSVELQHLLLPLSLSLHLLISHSISSSRCFTRSMLTNSSFLSYDSMLHHPPESILHNVNSAIDHRLADPDSNNCRR